MEKEYGKKSYRLFIVWIIGFISILAISGVLIEKNFKQSEVVVNKIILLLALLLINTLFYIIYKTEKVYWINGTSYEDAKSVTSERRKVFALKHLKSFSIAGCIYLVYCIFSIVIKSHVILDSLVFLILLIVAAIKTFNYRL